MVTYVKHDLEFILAQIKIAEAHAAATGGGGDLEASRQALLELLPNGLEPLGLRTVDGTLNNLIFGQSEFGAASGVELAEFPSLLPPDYGDDADGDTFDTNGPAPNGIVSNTDYAQSNGSASGGNVADADPRLISNLIVDMTGNNPAAVQAALDRDGSFAFDHDNDPTTADLYYIPNQAPDEGLSAPFNSWMTMFGQFFDHGLDLINKGGSGTIFMPLQPDDPLYDASSPQTNFMVLTRASVNPGADHILGTADDVMLPTNDTTSFVDQNQTYTSHSSHQVFLREYVLLGGEPVATGKLIQGQNGGMATWADVKAQALNVLGIALDDGDIDVPLLATDQYGNFIPGANGFPQVVIGNTLVEGSIGAPVDASLAVRTGHLFLADIAHNAVPVLSGGVLVPDADGIAGNPVAVDPLTGRNLAYDDELLDAHFIAGDGRANENFGLTAVHHVFHSEHNRLADHTKEVILESNDLAFLNEWLAVDVAALPTTPAQIAALVWDGERIFQAAKFGTEMQYQHLVFEEFARKVQPLINIFGPYDATIDPSIVSEFANTVYRFGHSMLTETVDLLNEDGTLTEVGLIQAFLNPIGFHQQVTANGTVDPTAAAYDPEAAAGAVIRGMTRQTGNEIDEFVTDAVRNNLLGLPLDLAAINIARGRDTGVPTLNDARTQFYAGTSDPKLKPYESWFDFAMNLKNEMSIINFIAAYGTHDLILAADTAVEKRDAAMKLVFGDSTLTDPAEIAAFNLDRVAFLNATGIYAGGSLGGLNDVDLWIGGLAEAIEPFGGMLGSTFNFVFEEQMEKLQDADRFYYLNRTAGLNFLTQLEQNSFAGIIMKNTDLGVDETDVTDFTTHLPGDIFSSPSFILEAHVDLQQDYNVDPLSKDPTGDSILIPLVIRVDSDGDGNAEKLQFTGGDHVVLGGTNFDDHLIGGIGDDTLWGDGGNDRLEGGNGADMLLGGSGDDIITDSGGPGPDNLQGQDGNDVLAAGPGEALLLAGAGKDYVLAGINLKETFGGEGDDFINAGDDANTVFGGEGGDWIEGGEGNDLLQGDNGDPFQTSAIIGNDVIIGGGGDDDYDSESGDDIMVGSPGIERHEGSLGFDWATFKDDPFGIQVDMTLRAFDETPLPPSNESILDRFDSVEGLSGSSRADILRGDNRDPAEFDAGPQPGVLDNVLRNFDLISGLRGTTVNAPATSNALFGSNVTEWGEGEIILGGDGSDIIEGRGGNDLIDGDLWLNVRIAVRDAGGNQLGTVDSMQGLFTATNTTVGAWVGKQLNELMLDGTINPGNLHVVREILTDTTNNVAGTAGYNGDFDTVVFSGVRAEYTVETLANGSIGDLDGDGYITVTHIDPNDATVLGADGQDKLRHVERLRFSDQTIPLVEGANAEPVGAPTINDTTPQVGQTLTVSIGGVTDADNVSTSGAITAPFVIFWQVEADPGTGVFSDIIIVDPISDEEIAVTGTSFTVTADLDGLALRVRLLYQDQGGVLEEVASAATAPVSPTVGTITGTAGPDNLIGTAGPDQIDGLGGADTIDGLGGADTINGGTGTDTINGGAGADLIHGNENSDDIFGDAGADTLFGDQASDHIDGGAGADTIFGGIGNDLVLFGNAGADEIHGEGGDDEIDGGAGADTLFGDAGNDTIFGGAGADTINGGGADDIITGGAGVDTFVFTNGFGSDWILDFDDAGGGQDIIDLLAFGAALDFVDLTIVNGVDGAEITAAGFAGFGTIVIDNITSAQLGADDFTFA